MKGTEMRALRLREATLADEVRLLAWRNDRETRAASFDTRAVAPDVHRAWLHSKLEDPECVLLIIESGDDAIGQVRMEERDDDESEVHISLDERSRMRGLAPAVLELAATEAASRLGTTALRAHVKPDNIRSLQAFKAGGFEEVERTADSVTLKRALRR